MKHDRYIGLGDISYCATKCTQKLCMRNLKYWTPPIHIYSVCDFDKECSDDSHPECKHSWIVSKQELKSKRKENDKNDERNR